MVKNQKSKGLGRGIDALFGGNFDSIENLEKVDTTNETVEEISINEIRPNPYQPRKEFNEEALQELADSIREQGVFQPIIVRKSSIKGYELVAGERRLRASKLAGKETIPSIIREYSEEIMIQVAVVENLQREDLRPIDEALAYKSLMDALKLNQEEVAKKIGKSRPYIANFLRLLSLPLEVQTQLQEGQLSVGHARALLGLKQADKIVPVSKKVIEEGMTVRALEELIQTMNEPVEKVKKIKKIQEKPAYIVESEERLMDKFGTSVQITPKGERGKIEIEYLSQKDLTRILDVLEIELDD